MSDERGQTLVIFVIVLPVILLVFAFLYDQGILAYEKNKLNQLSDIACTTLKKEKDIKRIEELLLKNDSSLKEIKINLGDKNTVHLVKQIDVIFGVLFPKEKDLSVIVECKS